MLYCQSQPINFSFNELLNSRLLHYKSLIGGCQPNIYLWRAIIEKLLWRTDGVGVHYRISIEFVFYFFIFFFLTSGEIGTSYWDRECWCRYRVPRRRRGWRFKERERAFRGRKRDRYPLSTFSPFSSPSSIPVGMKAERIGGMRKKGRGWSRPPTFPEWTTAQVLSLSNPGAASSWSPLRHRGLAVVTQVSCWVGGSLHFARHLAVKQCLMGWHRASATRVWSCASGEQCAMAWCSGGPVKCHSDVVQGYSLLSGLWWTTLPRATGVDAGHEFRGRRPHLFYALVVLVDDETLTGTLWILIQVVLWYLVHDPEVVVNIPPVCGFSARWKKTSRSAACCCAFTACFCFGLASCMRASDVDYLYLF